MMLIEITFNQQLILASLTLLAGGIVAPLFLKFKEAQRENELRKKRYSEETEGRKKQYKEEKQLLLLDAFADALWEWRYVAKKVPFYGSSLTENSEALKKYQEEYKEYDSNTWEPIKNLRVAVSKAMVYFPAENHDFIRSIYTFVIDTEAKIINAAEMTNAENQVKKFKELSEYFSDKVSKEIDNFIIEFSNLIQKNK